MWNNLILFICVKKYQSTITFIGVSKYCDPALTHIQPILTKLRELQLEGLQKYKWGHTSIEHCVVIDTTNEKWWLKTPHTI